MGITGSYLKIKPSTHGYALGFIFEHGQRYVKVIVAAGHPDNAFMSETQSTKQEYDSYGDWYLYNGDSDKLHAALTSFRPKNDAVRALISRLEVECELKKYESTWGVIFRWAKTVITFVPQTLFQAAMSAICSGVKTTNQITDIVELK